jgi:uncharacterized protein (DUF2141 family)/rhodanese-related sulfurtransferase
MASNVTSIPAAPSAAALAHFEAALQFETDCWDVHDALAGGRGDFVLLDVRSPALYAQGHVPGAINLPHGKIVASKLAAWPPETLFVTYCAGPHCNGGHRGAARLARLGRPVKLMIGGITGWLDEGFALEAGSGHGAQAPAAHAGEVVIEVEGAQDRDAPLVVALFDATGFLKRPLATAVAAADESRLVFRGLAAGRYAATAFLDLNGDGQLNRNLFGAPTEPYGFSRGATGRMGPPSFDDAAFEVGADAAHVQVRLQ